MAATPSKEDALLVSQCLDFCQMLAGKSIPFSFCLKVGHNSFSVDTRGKGALSSAKKKKPTPSTLRRNARRREEFLQKKLASTTPVSKPVSEQGTEDLRKPPEPLRHHASPSTERRQVITGWCRWLTSCQDFWTSSLSTLSTSTLRQALPWTHLYPSWP